MDIDVSFHPAGHIRETTTPIDGLLVSDCSCGGEYSVPWGGNEYAKLEQAHAEHIAAVSRQQAVIAPNGCCWCGVEERDHYQRWTLAGGWHGYEPPTNRLRLERMLARRKAHLAVRGES